MKHTLLALAHALPFSACGGLEAPESSGTLQIEAHTEPDPPHVGQNALVLHVRDADGNPVEGAAITVDTLMPSMGHGSTETPVITETGGGAYRAEPLTFQMTGSWQAIVQVVKGEEDGSRTFSWDVR